MTLNDEDKTFNKKKAYTTLNNVVHGAYWRTFRTNWKMEGLDALLKKIRGNR